MKKISILLSSALLLIYNNANALNMVATNKSNKWTGIADIICSGFVILGVTLVVVFGTKSIINTFKDKRNEV